MKKEMIEELDLEAIPYYGEDNMGATPPIHVMDRICHDCDAKYGEYHLPNCDMERCPKCGGQLISCGCLEDAQDLEAIKEVIKEGKDKNPKPI